MSNVLSKETSVWDNLPKDWQVKNLKHVSTVQLSNIDKLTVEGQERVLLCNYVDVYKNEKITSTIPFMQATATDEQIKRLSVRKGDVLFTKDSETPEDIGVPALVNEDLKGVVCGYHLAMARPNPNQLFGDYLFRVLQSEPVKQYFFTKAVGMTRWGLDKQALSDVPIPLPPLPEQRAIADYLDHETKRLDSLIAAKEHLLELLAEKRQAIITYTITRGLNSNAPLRDSGVEEIEKIPGHWEVKKLKYVTPQITVGIVITPSKYYVDKGVPCPRSLNVKNGKLTEDDLVYISQESNQELYKSMIFKGDLVSVRSGQTGATAIVDDRFDGANCIDLIITRKSHRFDSEFMVYLLNSEVIQRQFALGSGGAIQQHFNIETAKELLVLLPPMDEQKQIVNFLEETNKRIDRLAELANKTIEHLHERRASLIAAAVSGQIKVT